MLEGFETLFVLGDKAYDANSILLTITQKGAEPVIPPKSNRKEPRTYDQELYKERHLVECFIGKLKQYRRCFSRFDKLAPQLSQLLTLRFGPHLVAVKCQQSLAHAFLVAIQAREKKGARQPLLSSSP